MSESEIKSPRKPARYSTRARDRPRALTVVHHRARLLGSPPVPSWSKPRPSQCLTWLGVCDGRADMPLRERPDALVAHVLHSASRVPQHRPLHRRPAPRSPSLRRRGLGTCRGESTSECACPRSGRDQRSGRALRPARPALSVRLATPDTRAQRVKQEAFLAQNGA